MKYYISFPVLSMLAQMKIYLHKDGNHVGHFKPKDRKVYTYLKPALKAAKRIAEGGAATEVIQVGKRGCVASYESSYIFEDED